MRPGPVIRGSKGRVKHELWFCLSTFVHACLATTTMHLTGWNFERASKKEGFLRSRLGWHGWSCCLWQSRGRRIISCLQVSRPCPRVVFSKTNSLDVLARLYSTCGMSPNPPSWEQETAQPSSKTWEKGLRGRTCAAKAQLASSQPEKKECPHWSKTRKARPTACFAAKRPCNRKRLQGHPGAGKDLRPLCAECWDSLTEDPGMLAKKPQTRIVRSWAAESFEKLATRVFASRIFA